MKILVWHCKYGRRYFAASTSEQIAAAKWQMFGEMDMMDYYYELAHATPPQELPPGYEYTQQELDNRRWGRDTSDEVLAYRKAKDEHDYKYLCWLLDMRDGYEYESWSIETVEEPL